MKKLILIFLCTFFSIQVYSQSSIERYNKFVNRLDDNTMLNLAPVNLEPNPLVFLPNLDPGKTIGDWEIGPEIPTTIQGYYDYKTNAEANHYIQVDPSDPLRIHVIDTQADENDPGGATSRRTKYGGTSDGASTWAFLADVPNIRSGFGVLGLLDGKAVISNHNTDGGGLNTNLYVDAFSLLGAFTTFLQPDPVSIWPQQTVLNNGNVLVLSRPQSATTAANDSLFYTIWDGVNFGSKELMFFASPPYQGGVAFSNMAFNVANNNNGTVGVALNPKLMTDTLDVQVIRMRLSNDNGQTFGPLFDIFRPFTENGGMDTIYVTAGSDLIFKQNSEDWFYSCIVSADGFYSTARLCIVKGTGNTVTSIQYIADSNNVDMTLDGYRKPWVFQFTIDHPSLGWSDDGSLYVVYDVVTPDSGMNGFNTRDIYYQFSNDEGTSWSEPIRVTETPMIDEGFPSASSWNPANELHIVYMKDPGDGPTSFNGSSPTAPPSLNQQIYRKITEANVSVGNNSELVKDFQLYQNFPNPFNPVTTIKFSIPVSSNVTLKVFDATGREVRSLINNEVVNAGTNEVSFNATNLPSGIYFYTIQANDFIESKKMILIK